MTRYTPTELREMADSIDPYHRNAYGTADMLRQAASDALDAERYRWLRDIANPVEATILHRVYEDIYVKDGDHLDHAIDAARNLTKEG